MRHLIIFFQDWLYFLLRLIWLFGQLERVIDALRLISLQFFYMLAGDKNLLLFLELTILSFIGILVCNILIRLGSNLAGITIDRSASKCRM